MNRPLRIDLPIIAAARATFTTILQHLLDVLFDVTRHSYEGVANFGKIGLFYWTVDELLAAFHLAQRGLTSQSYAHVRTVFEIRDKIELFEQQPKWAELWVKGTEQEVWKELRPAEVRKKLGEPKYDPIYSFFSELGVHGSFRGLQARV